MFFYKLIQRFKGKCSFHVVRSKLGNNIFRSTQQRFLSSSPLKHVAELTKICLLSHYCK